MPEPFLKWAGGKRWLVARHQRLFPIVFERYVEPFLGGGAVFFFLEPQRALLSDTNRELIDVYRVIRDEPIRLRCVLASYQAKHSSTFYYQTREQSPKKRLHRAARTLYLNRVCWNGLFRVNLKGEFNVPIGTKSEVAYPRGFLSAVSRALKRARIRNLDFEEILDQTGAGDFVYVDPPYTVMHNNNGFLKYNDVLFSWNDQVRLAAAVRRASKRGAMILVSNADHFSIHTLYRNFGQAERLSRCSVLAGDSSARGTASEVTYRNYRV
jgi:DNA adenine methylase